MAALQSLSLRQLERRFARHFGKTPTEWSRELRCRLAKELVAQGCSNKEVAAELKFANPAQLCHEFHKVYGSSPQSFASSYAIKLNQEPPIAAPEKN